MSKITSHATHEFAIEGNTARFFCYSHDTRNGFAHTAEYTGPYAWDVENVHTCHYLNRTWELYRYQSACMGIAREMLENARDSLKREWMDARGYARMTAARREAFKREDLTRDPEYRYASTLVFAIECGPHFYHLRNRAGERELNVLDHVQDIEFVQMDAGAPVFRIWGEEYTHSILWHDGRREFVG